LEHITRFLAAFSAAGTQHSQEGQIINGMVLRLGLALLGDGPSSTRPDRVDGSLRCFSIAIAAAEEARFKALEIAFSTTMPARPARFACESAQHRYFILFITAGKWAAR
jgi:hypothetical protein